VRLTRRPTIRVGRVGRVVAFAATRHRLSHHDVFVVNDVVAGNECAGVDA
jgi:hypothetical protein